MPLHLPAAFRRFASTRTVCAAASLLLLAGAAAPASARRAERHRHPHLHAIAHALMNVAMPGAGLLPGDDDELPTDGQEYRLKLARPGEGMVDVVYRIGDTYIPDALEKLSGFLHDSHTDEVKTYDPRTFDVLHTMLAKVDRSSSIIDILSAYRSQETNDALRASHTTNAAEHSQHIEGRAIDIRVPGVPAVTLRDAALSIGAGGVGYYPGSQFVHVDTGPVRQWTYAPRRVSRRGTGHAGRRSRRRGRA